MVIRGRRGLSWLVVLPISAAVAVFLPVVWRPFIYDEFVHLYNLVNFGPIELLVTPHGGHLLFVSNLVYLPLYKLFGVWTPAYYAVALVTHLVNVALCCRVIARFTGRPAVAALAATVWGSAAANVGALGWFAVYGQLLLATILLWALQDVARLAAEDAVPSRRISVWWSLLLIAACGSFGYGLVIAALFLPVVVYMLDAGAGWRAILVRFVAASAAVVVLYLGQHQLHAAVSGRATLYGVEGILGGVGSLSWSDVTAFGHAVLASTAYGVSGLLIGPLLYLGSNGSVADPPQELSKERAELAVWIALVVWLPLWIFWLWRRPRADVRKAIGLGVLALGCYALLAARVVAPNRTVQGAAEAVRAAGLDEWVLSPIARVTGLRYQYLPSLLLTLATAVALPSLVSSSRSVRAASSGAAVLWALLSVLLDRASVRANSTGKPSWHPQTVVENRLRRDVSRFPAGSTVYVDNGPAPIAFARPDDILPGRAAIALLLRPQGVIDGHRVFFVEHDPHLLEQVRAAAATPIAQLVVGADEVPSDAFYVRDQAPRGR